MHVHVCGGRACVCVCVYVYVGVYVYKHVYGVMCVRVCMCICTYICQRMGVCVRNVCVSGRGHLK